MHPTSLAIGTGLSSGILSHILIFSKGEWDLYTIKILQGLLIVIGLLALSFKRLGTTEAGSPYSVFESTIASIYVMSLIVSGTFCSIFLYRICFFHCLSSFRVLSWPKSPIYISPGVPSPDSSSTKRSRTSIEHMGILCE